MIRLFITDLDDTLLNKQKQIDSHNLQSLEKLKQAGLQVGIASGRNEVEIEQVIKNVPSNFHQVCQNGASIYLNNKTLIHQSRFDQQLAQDLYQKGKSTGFSCFIGTPTHMYIPEESEQFRQMAQRISVRLELDATIERRLGEDLIPSKFCYYGKASELKDLEKMLNDAFPGQLDSFLSSPYCLDIMPKGVNKGTGVQKLANNLGISLSEVACIGDSENDVSMFGVTPHSFVMDVAKPSVQQSANSVVSSVAEAVEWVLSYNQQLLVQK
jgi:Cof subfamily protein (haloacid dehalogenase superfamily)